MPYEIECEIAHQEVKSEELREAVALDPACQAYATVELTEDGAPVEREAPIELLFWEHSQRAAVWAGEDVAWLDAEDPNDALQQWAQDQA